MLSTAKMQKISEEALLILVFRLKRNVTAVHSEADPMPVSYKQK